MHGAERVELYLQEKLTAAAKRRSDFDLPGDPWPCDQDLTALTRKSSGLFIFASTLARFIKSEHHELNERLQLIVTPSDSTVHCEGRAGIGPLHTRVLMHDFVKTIDDGAASTLAWCLTSTREQCGFLTTSQELSNN